ncbi:hypothetical protein Tco_1446874 [Tanacetum coccineum]
MKLFLKYLHLLQSQPSYRLWSLRTLSSWGIEHLATFSGKESDEFIKSSVKDLVPIPSKSEDTFDSDSECDLPICDNSLIFSNPLFDSNDDFTLTSDRRSLTDDDVLKDNVLTDIESEESYVSKLDEPDLLVTPLSKLNEDECFEPGELYFADFKMIKSSIDTPLDFEDDYYDSEGDIINLESLVIKDIILNLPPEVFLDRDPRSLKYDPDKDV